jgi:hypothetical protein
MQENHSVLSSNEKHLSKGSFDIRSVDNMTSAMYLTREQ